MERVQSQLANSGRNVGCMCATATEMLPKSLKSRNSRSAKLQRKPMVASPFKTICAKRVANQTLCVAVLCPDKYGVAFKMGKPQIAHAFWLPLNGSSHVLPIRTHEPGYVGQTSFESPFKLDQHEKAQLSDVDASLRTCSRINLFCDHFVTSKGTPLLAH